MACFTCSTQHVTCRMYEGYRSVNGQAAQEGDAQLMDLRRLPPSDGIADTVYETLRDAIFSGAVPPGTKLSVPAIAVRLGVSRSPVREAVLRLKQEQLANYEPRRGAVVAPAVADRRDGVSFLCCRSDQSRSSLSANQCASGVGRTPPCQLLGRLVESGIIRPLLPSHVAFNSAGPCIGDKASSDHRETVLTI